jgi:hypothetical protein
MKKLAQFSKNYRTFFQKNRQKALKTMVLGSGIRDPGSGKNLSRIQGSKRHLIPDPDPQHCNYRKSLDNVNTSDADPDPGSGACLTLDPGWVKNQDPDLGWKNYDPG